ncbi:rhodanese-like domain-containing protein [Shewanella sp. 1_MG-2023]|uniref:rhodanese-like domain-containing protein n=1 Tax=unclassified Shewanella TaxID=196818 RepID=UPI0034C6922D
MQQRHSRFFHQTALLVIGSLALMFSAISSAEDKVPSVAWDKINAGAILLDVRTEQEFAAGHLEGAINIPFEVVLNKLTEQKLSKDTSIVLYCRSGRRSGIATAELVKAGFTQSYNGGGFEILRAHETN